jgi:hypothetical protein
MVIDVGGPAIPVAVNVTDRLPLEAVSVFVPAVVPSVHPPMVAMPLTSVAALGPVALPPPDATANVTVMPLMGLPAASFTITLGADATAEPATAL